MGALWALAGLESVSYISHPNIPLTSADDFGPDGRQRRLESPFLASRVSSLAGATKVEVRLVNGSPRFGSRTCGLTNDVP